MKPFFFNNNRHPRKFDYKPVFYDQRKEALQKRIEDISLEANQSDIKTEDLISSKKESISEQAKLWRAQKNNKRTYFSSFSNVGIFLAIISLIIIVWLLFFH